MKIIVCVKQTFDTEAKITLNEQGQIDERRVKFIINPFDEYAVEEAIHLTEKESGEVTAVSASKNDPSQVLRRCLAMGVDRAVWLDCGNIDNPDGRGYAEVLAQWLKTEEYDIIFCGKEAVDDGASEVPSRLAEILNLPQVNVVSQLSMEGRKVTARRDIEGGSEIIEVNLPVLLSAQKDLNKPRYPSMRRVLEAKKTTIEKVSLEELGLSEEAVAPYMRVDGFMLPPPRQAGRIITGSCQEAVGQLINILRGDKKII